MQDSNTSRDSQPESSRSQFDGQEGATRNTEAPADGVNGPPSPPRQTGGGRPVRIMGEQGQSPRDKVTPPEPGKAPVESDVRPPDKPYRAHPDLRHEQLVRGSHPGDRYVRYDRNIGPFRRKAGGVLAASLETETARSGLGRAFNTFKRVVIGAPLSTERSIHERLTKVKALAVLSSDALSSVAYATEEILKVLIIAGMGAVAGYSMPIGIAVMLLLVIVAASYRQTIAAYPRGGGSYIVAKDNLGTLPGLTAAASILIDYTMTVAVSVSSGMDAINSLYPSLIPFKVEICLVIVLLVTIANLRGVREAGNIFAVPTYLFIFGIIGMVALGLAREFLGVGGGLHYTPPANAFVAGAEPLTLFLLLRAFSQGCTALTGVEAIADGVPAFKPPESNNARITLVWMAVIATTMFGGITLLASKMQVVPSGTETVLSQVARNVFAIGPSWFSQGLWFYVNITTALILMLAANTAFSDFPRLSYFLARDKFMPHQYSFRGDRLAFSWGIVTLATLAAVLITAFKGDVNALIPLYTVGVFNSFTLSQLGMVRRWWRTRTPGWQRSMAVNGLGALATFVVLLISAYTKFLLGAWIVVVLIPVIILMFLAINRHYRRFDTEMAESATLLPTEPTEIKHTVIVPVARLNKIAMSALAYARSLSPNVTAVHIAEGEDPEEAGRFNDAWHRVMPTTDIPLVIIESPYRSLVGPLLSYIDALDQQSPDDTITIVLPEMLPSSPWEYLLHGQSALRLKARLLFRPNTVVANIPYRVGRWRGTEPSTLGWLRALPWTLILASSGILALAYWLFFPHR